MKSWCFVYYPQCDETVWLGSYMKSSVRCVIILPAIKLSCVKAAATVEARRLQAASGSGCAVMTTWHTLKTLMTSSESYEVCWGGLCSVFPTGIVTLSTNSFQWLIHSGVMDPFVVSSNLMITFFARGEITAEKTSKYSLCWTTSANISPVEKTCVCY